MKISVYWLVGSILGTAFVVGSTTWAYTADRMAREGQVLAEQAATAAFIRGANSAACNMDSPSCDGSFEISTRTSAGDTAAYQFVDGVIIAGGNAHEALPSSCTGYDPFGVSLGASCNVHLERAEGDPRNF